MIEVDELTVAFEDLTTIEDVDLAIDSGEFVTIIGPSGYGKTTLLRAIRGLQEPTSGRVLVDRDAPEAAQATANLGYVFQQHTLFPWKTAFQNVTFLRRVAGKSSRPKRSGT